MHTPKAANVHRGKMIKRQVARRVEVIVMAVLLAVALAHLLRLVTGAEVTIAGSAIPVWASLPGCIGPAALAGLFWWTHR